MKTLEHKGFIGSVNFSEEDKIFFGKIEGINALVTFEGKTIEEFKIAFEDTVSTYLEANYNKYGVFEQISDNTYYIVGRRDDENTIIEENCFLGSTFNKCIEWIKDNKGYDSESYSWHWSISHITLDDKSGGFLVLGIDWDGNKIEKYSTNK